MRRWQTILVVGAALTSCSSTGVGHGTSPSVSPPAPSPSAPSASASGAPAPESPLATGVATVDVSGDLTLTVVFPTLGPSAVWAPPPAPMALTWEGPGAEELGLTGTSFLSREETSADRALTFVVNGPEGPVEFSSTAGECSVTITPALPDNMGGLFTCTALTDAAGTTTVDARGIFSASG